MLMNKMFDNMQEAVPKTISDSSDKVQSMVTWIVPLVGLILLVVLVASIWIRRKQRTKTTDPETNSSIQVIPFNH